MAKGNDRDHFDEYRLQTQVKHDILTAYLKPYYRILKKWTKNLVLIDGFAGRSNYTDENGRPVAGSPLRVLELIANHDDFGGQVTTFFIEKDEEIFAELEKNTAGFYKRVPKIRKPVCLNGTFAEEVGWLLDAVKGNLAPTFLFVDPCGVEGASFNAIKSIMDCDKCETFIFFNMDGVRRVAGLGKPGDTLIEFMGSKERAQRLIDAFKIGKDPQEREQIILDHYRMALREIGVEYIIPFRVEKADRKATSHYLIHASKHPLGFRIMKEVMWKRGRTADQLGALEMAQASVSDYSLLIDIRTETIKAEIRKGLKDGPLKVETFYITWPEKPDNLLCEPAYKPALLEMEADGEIEVLDKNMKIKPAANRQREGKTTLGKDNFVRLKA